MSTLKVGSIQNLSGTKEMNTSDSDLLGVGALQVVQSTTSDVINFTSLTTLMSTSFTPKSTTSKLLISTNISCTNTQTNDWTLYTIYLYVDDTKVYTRYVGSHYHQAYVPVDLTYVYNSWGISAKTISIKASPHASYTHQFNRKVWDSANGAENNTSTLRIMEIETL